MQAAIDLLAVLLPLLVIAPALLRDRRSHPNARWRPAHIFAALGVAALLAALMGRPAAAVIELTVAFGALLAALSLAIGTSPADEDGPTHGQLRVLLLLLAALSLLAVRPEGWSGGVLWALWIGLAAWLTALRDGSDAAIRPIPLIGAALVLAGALTEGTWAGPWLLLTGVATTIPLFPLHRWYLSLLTQGRTPERILVAALMPAMALILLLSRSEAALAEIAPFLAAWGAISLGYAALRAFAQSELRRVVAFAAMACAALVPLGIGHATAASQSGAALQAWSLAIGSGGLALLCARLPGPSLGLPLSELGGLATAAPRLALALVALLLVLMQTPLLGGFAAWWLVLMGSEGVVSSAALALLLLLSASVVARLMRQTIFGPVGPLAARQPDLAPRELALFGVLIGADLVLGLAPALVLSAAGLATG